LGGRRKRQSEGCRKEGLLVGATYIGSGYINEVKSEQECIEKCNAEQECNAINYFPQNEDCLLQRETLISDVDRLHWRKDESAVYVIVKGCTGSMPEPKPELDSPATESTDEPTEPETPEPEEPQPEEPQPEEPTESEQPAAETRHHHHGLPFLGGRRKRQSEGCRKEGLMVGGTLIDNKYITEVETEADCVAKCNELETCVAVNYFPEHKACWPQEESLATHKDSLYWGQNSNTVYVIVKGCDGTFPEPNPELEVHPAAETRHHHIHGLPFLGGRRKRQIEGCRKDGLMVGGSPVTEGYLENIKTEEDCVAECNKLEKCTAVNYFPQHEACLPQEENLNNTPDLQTREEEITNYIIVKGCGGSQPFPPLPRPEGQ